MSDIGLAVALLVTAATAIAFVCFAMMVWSRFAERVFDQLFGAMEAAIRWIASR